MTTSAIERRPLSTDQLTEHVWQYFRSCPVAVIYRVTAIYRAVQVDCIFFFFNFFFLLLSRLLIRGNALPIQYGTCSF